MDFGNSFQMIGSFLCLVFFCPSVLPRVDHLGAALGQLALKLLSRKKSEI